MDQQSLRERVLRVPRVALSSPGYTSQRRGRGGRRIHPTRWFPVPADFTGVLGVPDEQIVEHDLFERATRVSEVDRRRYEAEWHRLREENGPLRVLADSGLVSAPITQYDDTILSFVADEWQNCATVVARTFAALGEGPYRQCTSDQLIFGRLLTLIDEELVEGKNEQELWSMRESWVRRRRATTSAT